MEPPDPLVLARWLTGETPSEAAIPDAELTKLAQATVRAHGFAAEERYLTGYLTLYSGLIVATERGEPWAAHVAPLWAQALAEFKTRYPRNWGNQD